MHTTIRWTGQLYNSIENCSIRAAATGNNINGTIDGRLENNPFNIAYFIKINKNWETISFHISADIAAEPFNLYFESNGQGSWTSKGIPAPEFNGCIEIDISLTPFTNSLPINRLKLANKERRKIAVLYVDVLKQQTRRVEQFYTRLSDTVYKYENASGKFKSVITVDGAGLVIAYPDHFMRTGVK